jgi:hypothetical protein
MELFPPSSGTSSSSSFSILSPTNPYDLGSVYRNICAVLGPRPIYWALSFGVKDGGCISDGYKFPWNPVLVAAMNEEVDVVDDRAGGYGEDERDTLISTNGDGYRSWGSEQRDSSVFVDIRGGIGSSGSGGGFKRD